ncbi:MAG: glycosyltransferase WbuB, partial [Sedimenticola sp.]|nr:glycosyltransferase WbuB [Sedimenticola sp.]
KELIRDGENGRLFRAGDKNSLADAALDMIKQTNDSSELRRKGLEYVEKERNWVVSVANYKNVYNTLLAGE